MSFAAPARSPAGPSRSRRATARSSCRRSTAPSCGSSGGMRRADGIRRVGTCYSQAPDQQPGGKAGPGVSGVSVMNKLPLIAAALIAAFAISASKPAQAAGLERLYILNCGEGTAGDISRWSPGVNVGKSMPFVDNCYLIKHSDGWMVWDTGITDAVAAMPNGLAPQDPRMTHWKKPVTLAAQLEQLGVKP